MYQQIRIFINGFVIILVIMILLALVAFQINYRADTSANTAVTNQLEKISLTQQISDIASRRIQLIQAVLLRREGFEAASAWQAITQLDQSFNQISENLFPLINAREGGLLLEINQINTQIAELNQQVSVFLVNENYPQANQILRDNVLPVTAPLMEKLWTLNNIQRDNVNDVLQLAAKTADANQQRFVLYAVFSILASLVVAGLAVFYGHKMSKHLEDINEYLEEKISERTESLLDTQKELIEDNNELARLASTDALTGLFNRNYMNDILMREYSRYQRYGQLFGIIIIDIDYFKRVNDLHGHDVGDLVLIQMAQQLKAAVRNSDFVGRWGGEEFLICCTTIETGDLEPIAEHIRNTIAETEFDIINNLTISLGCAIIQPAEEVDSLIKRSDIALYQAKNAGRNKTIVSAVNTRLQHPA